MGMDPAKTKGFVGSSIAHAVKVQFINELEEGLPGALAVQNGLGGRTECSHKRHWGKPAACMSFTRVTWPSETEGD